MTALWHVAVVGCCMLLAALMLWPQVRYARQLSLAQGALMGVGAYVAALLLLAGTAWPISITVAALAGAGVGFCLAAVSESAEGDTYALVTLGAQLVFANAFILARSVTGGATGLFFIPGSISFNAIALGMLLVCVMSISWFLWRLPQSQFGMKLQALGDDPVLFEAQGMNSQATRRWLGTLAGAGAAAGGAILVMFLQVAEPSLFDANRSIALLAMVLLLPGRPLVSLTSAVGIFIGVPEALRFLGVGSHATVQLREALFSTLLILVAFRQLEEPQALPGALRSKAEL